MPAPMPRALQRRRRLSLHRRCRPAWAMPNLGRILLEVLLPALPPPLPVLQVVEAVATAGHSGTPTAGGGVGGSATGSTGSTGSLSDSKKFVATKPLSAWSVADVCAWMTSLGPAYGKIATSIVVENAIDGRQLAEIDASTWEELGLVQAFHRKRLMNELAPYIRAEKEAAAGGGVGGGGLPAFATAPAAGGVSAAAAGGPVPLSSPPSSDGGEANIRVVPWSELTILSDIGEGSFGRASKARWKSAPVVVKTLKLQGDKLTPDVMRAFGREVALLSRLAVHPSVVQFVGKVLEPGHVGLVMHEARNGTVEDVLIRRKKLLGTGPEDRRVVARMACDLAAALDFLHTEKPPIVHRDIATRNALVTELNRVWLNDCMEHTVVRPACIRCCRSPFCLAAALGADTTQLRCAVCCLQSECLAC
jgi:hypothetical protein